METKEKTLRSDKYSLNKKNLADGLDLLANRNDKVEIRK